MPLLMTFVLRSSGARIDEGELPMGVAGATLVGGTGMVLILVVSMGLVSALVARREELVLKRPRTGEASDLELLAGAALPSGAIALAQCAVLTAGGIALLDLPAPRRPELLVLGLLAGVALLTAAAATTVITRNVESAGITTLPFFLVSAMGSGMLVPTDVPPDAVADVCRLLLLSGVMEFVRAGWFGVGEARALHTAGLNTLAWGTITVFAVRRWFRWEPRRQKRGAGRVSRLTGWWSGRSSAAKVELYTRWTFHVFAPLEIMALGGVPFSRDQDSRLGDGTALALFLLICAHAVLSAVVASRALDWAVERRERPVRHAAALGGFTGSSSLALLVLDAAGVTKDSTVTTAAMIGLIVFTLGTLVMCLRRVRHMSYAVLGTAIGTGAAVAALGIGAGPALGSAVAVLLGGSGLGAACGFSSWLLKVVRELERSKELQARLAVAEERLRFGRDLHDVMGRNLSVIALKSELAVQLARRERPEAVDQMIEVQRIAQESQREVRDVVRGYREADLRVELEGARGVLGAAGIDCAIDPVKTGLPAELPAEVQSVLGWVVRETTTNVLRHGDARRCAISLREQDGSVLLTVRNDGVREGAEMGRGSGLEGLRERLAAVGGTLEAGPDEGGSFRVTALVPVSAPDPVPAPDSVPAPDPVSAPASVPVQRRAARP